jgi:hypothetical protein
MSARQIKMSTRLFLFIGGHLLFLLVGCSKKLSFATSPVVPAAHGSVRIDRDKNENYTIEVDVTNLAEPKNLQPPRDTYVVWMETKKNGIKNIGQLNTSSGFFSSALKASLKTVTPNKPTRFFITAEDKGDVQYPGSQVVLRTAD